MDEVGAALMTVEQFVNTLDERTFHRHGAAHLPGDGLTSLAALTTWFAAHNLSSDDVEPEALLTARTLRAGLRAALTADRSTAEVLAEFPVRLRATATGLRLSSHTGSAGVDALVETVATSVADGRWKRLKVCASDDCRWAFYDTSRSGGGRWCSMEVCGNRHKTRTYRTRRAP